MGRSIFVLFTLLKFYFTPKPPTITFPSLPNPILTRPSTTWSIITIKLHQRTHPSSLLHPLETSLRRFKIFASLKPSIFQELFESRETSPFSRTPNFLSPSLLPFFLELISPLLHYRHSWSRCTTGRVNVFECVGRVSGFRLVDFTVRSRSAEDFEPLIPFPLSLAAHVFLANSALQFYSISGFFSPPERTPVFDNRFDQFNAKSRPEWFFFLVLLFAYLCCFRSVESSLVFYRKVVLFVIFFFKLDFLCKR